MADPAPTLPRQFGRYEVAATIAAPRCAEGSTIAIGIARAAALTRDASGRLALNIGPAAPNEKTKTVQMPVAIKRISPSLLIDTGAIATFLETARTAAEVRHPNVCEISEVHHEGGELFLVMDWLMGETAASLVRRLHSQGERLKPTLAAYVIAEACAGLEAGHAAGLVHAHLTPHDIFIGYDGQVQVLDIGIAAARRKLAGGRIAGVDIEYASPELCLDQTLDPRSDVFSLGTILWELLTGLSPFERASDVETMRAICEEDIVPPKKVVPGLPKEVSVITVQAVARDRGDRPKTAQALRTTLLEAVTKHGGPAPPRDQLGQLMNRIFEAREKDKRDLFGRVVQKKPIGTTLDVLALDRRVTPSRPLPPLPPRSRAAPPLPPSASLKPAALPEEVAEDSLISVSGISTPARSNAPHDAHVDQPSVIIKPTADPVPIGDLIPSTPPPAEPPPPIAPFEPLDADPPLTIPKRSGSGLAIALGLALVPAVLALVVVLRNRAQPRPVAFVDAGAPIVATRDVPPPPPPLPAAAPAASTVAVATSASAAVTPQETVLHIDTIPAQATISIGGVHRGVAPTDLRLPRSSEPITIEIRHPGYVTLQERVVPDVNQRLKLTLAAAHAKHPTGTHPAPTPAPSANPYRKFE